MSCVEGVVQRLKTYGDPDLKFDVKVTTSSLPVIFKRQGLGDFWVDYYINRRFLGRLLILHLFGARTLGCLTWVRLH